MGILDDLTKVPDEILTKSFRKGWLEYVILLLILGILYILIWGAPF